MFGKPNQTLIKEWCKDDRRAVQYLRDRGFFLLPGGCWMTPPDKDVNAKDQAAFRFLHENFDYSYTLSTDEPPHKKFRH